MIQTKELTKELELLADSCMSDYALETNGYNRGVLDALDVVNKYFDLALVVGRSEQFYCTCSRAKGLDHDEEGMPYCIECQKPVQ